MFSIWFYIGPNMTPLETFGFPTKQHAKSAIESNDKQWFTNAAAEEIFIPLKVRKEAIAIIRETE